MNGGLPRKYATANKRSSGLRATHGERTFLARLLLIFQDPFLRRRTVKEGLERRLTPAPSHGRAKTRTKSHFAVTRYVTSLYGGGGGFWAGGRAVGGEAFLCHRFNPAARDPPLSSRDISLKEGVARRICGALRVASFSRAFKLWGFDNNDTRCFPHPSRYP